MNLVSFQDLSCLVRLRNATASSPARRGLRTAFAAALRKSVLTPGISTGYWKQEDALTFPLLRRQSEQFFPSYVTVPPVTSSASLPAHLRELALPTRCGPFAWTSRG